MEDARQGSGVLQIQSVLSQERSHSGVRFVGPVVFGQLGVNAHEPHDMVVVLDQYQATRAKCANRPLDHFDPGRPR